MQRSHKTVRIKYSLTTSVSAHATEWPVQQQIFGLSLSVNLKASMLTKKDELPYAMVV